MWANYRLHDSPLYLEPAFEVFVDPDGDNWFYYGEQNARPTRQGSTPGRSASREALRVAREIELPASGSMGPTPTAARAELEYNALAVTWDLFMARPWRNGGPALNSFEAVQPSESTYTGPESGGRCCDCLARCRLSRGAAGRCRHC